MERNTSSEKVLQSGLPSWPNTGGTCFIAFGKGLKGVTRNEVEMIRDL